MILDFLFDFQRCFRVVEHELFGCFCALGDFCAAIAVPGATFLDDVETGAERDDFARFGDTFTENNVEFSDTERRCELVYCPMQ